MSLTKTLKTIDVLRGKGIQTVLSTSCSLLHVPYTLKHEEKLSPEYLSYFAFAEEKLTELKELKVLVERGAYSSDIVYQNNETLFTGNRNCENEEAKNRLSLVTDSDYIRLPKRSERQKLQKKALNLPDFPTTTIGSFPQTKDVKANRSAYRRQEISEEEYVAFTDGFLHTPYIPAFIGLLRQPFFGHVTASPVR